MVENEEAEDIERDGCTPADDGLLFYTAALPPDFDTYSALEDDDAPRVRAEAMLLIALEQAAETEVAEDADEDS